MIDTSPVDFWPVREYSRQPIFRPLYLDHQPPAECWWNADGYGDSDRDPDRDQHAHSYSQSRC